jgi:hypothetical protein
VSTATPDSTNLTLLNLNGGANSGQINAVVPLTFSFTDSDPANGANNIAYAQFALVDSSGNYNCYGDWGPPSALDLYLPTLRGTTTTGTPASPLNNSFCAVSLVSITDTSASAVTAEVNFTFSPTSAGTYTIMQQVNYLAGGTGPWESLGSLTVGPPSGPAVWITDLTSGNYYVGDSYSVTVTGQSNQQVTVSVDGRAAAPAVNAQGSSTTNAQGVWTTTGTWAAADVGNYAETYYVAGLQTLPGLSFQVASGPGTYTCGAISQTALPVVRVPGYPVTFTVNVSGISGANNATVGFQIVGASTNPYSNTLAATPLPNSRWTTTVNTTNLLGTYSATPVVIPSGGAQTACGNSVALFTVGTVAPSPPGPVSCSSMTGNWTDTLQGSDLPFAWSLTDNSGAVNGSASESPCAGVNVTWTSVTGTHTASTGQYSLTASGGSPSSFFCGGDPFNTTNQTISGTIQGQLSCGLGAGTHAGSYNVSDTLTIERIPSGETASASGAATLGTAYGYATSGIFNMALTSPSGSNYNFDGRAVQEIRPSQTVPQGYAGNDGCYWPGAPWGTPITALAMSSTWWVQSPGQSGGYGPDYIGLANPAWVAFTQKNSPLFAGPSPQPSCTIQFPQQMVINQESVAQPTQPTQPPPPTAPLPPILGPSEAYGTPGYGLNLLQITISPTTIQIVRGAQNVSQSFHF